MWTRQGRVCVSVPVPEVPCPRHSSSVQELPGAGLGTSDLPPRGVPEALPSGSARAAGLSPADTFSAVRSRFPQRRAQPRVTASAPRLVTFLKFAAGSAWGGGEWGPRVMGKTDALGKKRGNLRCALQRGDGPPASRTNRAMPVTL